PARAVASFGLLCCGQARYPESEPRCWCHFASAFAELRRGKSETATVSRPVELLHGDRIVSFLLKAGAGELTDALDSKFRNDRFHPVKCHQTTLTIFHR